MDRRRTGPAGLLSAIAVSQIGNVVAVVALPWFVLQTTGSAARTGIVAFATTVPLAVGAVAAGPLLDRLGVRPASVLADLGAAASIATIPVLHIWGHLSFGALLAFAFLAGTFEAPGRTARRAMLPGLAAGAGFSLERVNSVSTTTEHLGYVLGAPLAGGLIAGLGAPGALWLDAASFVGSAVIVASTVPALRSSAERPPLLAGLRFIRNSPIIRTFLIIWTAGAFLVTPLAGVMLPVYTNQRFGTAGALAAAVTALGAGGILGTLTFATVGRSWPRRRAFVVMWVTYPLLSCVLMLLPGLVPLLALLAAIGLVTGAYDPLEVTIYQENIPPPLRSQVFAALLAAEMTAVPLAMLTYGFLITSAGLRAGTVLFGAGNLALGAYALRAPATRRLGTPSRLLPPDRGTA
ncbi:MFS transporter [Actinoplanes sp. NPDC051343]|uniref:MFS transporter n=1 Tax=Actinoplanes sp. NPDC051343 TaxID=3363906 RepID=UPI0037ADCF7E